MTLLWDSLPKSIAEILSAISASTAIKPFILVGGTAIALQQGHRISEDIDLMLPSGRLRQCDINDVLQPLLEVERTPYDVMVALDFEDHGLQIDDYHQDYTATSLSGEKVKITFFTSDEGLSDPDLLASATSSNLRIADLETLFNLKSLVLGKRHKKRDLFDLMHLIINQKGSLEKLMSFHPDYIQPFIEQKLLSWPKNDLLAISFQGNGISDKQAEQMVRSFFKERIALLASEQAKNKLQPNK